MIVATLDRQVISITAAAIQRDLHLTDTQLGLLLGPAFAFCAAAASLPIGWLLDRRNRVTVAAFCFAIWSVTTTLIGFAGSFAALAVARSGGSIGEAGLAPAALSIIADRFPVRTIPRASALFLTAPFVGAGLGLFIGGALLEAFSHAALPALLSNFHPWQLVFLTVGPPGIFLALILKAVVHDHRRLTHAPLSPGSNTSTSDGTSTPIIAFYIVGMTALVLILFVQLAWLPLRLQRSFGLNAADAGLIIGPSYIVAGLLGAALSGWLAGRVEDARVLSRVTTIILLSTVLLVGPLVLGALGTDERLVGIGFFLGMLPLSTALTLAATPIQLLVSGQHRARTLALSSIAFNVVGAGIGPLLPGVLSDRLAGANAIGFGMAVVTTTAAAVAILAFGHVARGMRRQATVVEVFA